MYEKSTYINTRNVAARVQYVRKKFRPRTLPELLKLNNCEQNETTKNRKLFLTVIITMLSQEGKQIRAILIELI
jgi:hypothetical protein